MLERGNKEGKWRAVQKSRDSEFAIIRRNATLSGDQRHKEQVEAGYESRWIQLRSLNALGKRIRDEEAGTDPKDSEDREEAANFRSWSLCVAKIPETRSYLEQVCGKRSSLHGKSFRIDLEDGRLGTRHLKIQWEWYFFYSFLVLFRSRGRKLARRIGISGNRGSVLSFFSFSFWRGRRNFGRTIRNRKIVLLSIGILLFEVFEVRVELFYSFLFLFFAKK